MLTKVQLNALKWAVANAVITSRFKDLPWEVAQHAQILAKEAEEAFEEVKAMQHRLEGLEK